MEHWRQLLDDFSHNDGKARYEFFKEFACYTIIQTFSLVVTQLLAA
jgi:hypothetical protein